MSVTRLFRTAVHEDPDPDFDLYDMVAAVDSDEPKQVDLLRELVLAATEATDSTDLEIVTAATLHGLTQSQRDTLLNQAIATTLDTLVSEELCLEAIDRETAPDFPG